METKSFNLNLMLDEEALGKVKRWNKEFCKTLLSEIDFEKGCVPHITIIIYKVKVEDADAVNTLVWDYVKTKEFQTFKFKNIRTKNNYSLLEIENGDQIIQIANELMELIRHYVICFSKYPVSKDNPPHITLGWTKEIEKANKLYDGKTLKLTVKPSGIRLSDEFEHGSIRGGFKIKTF